MDKKNGFDKLDRFMREEYDQRVEDIENNLSDDGSFDPDRVDSDALRERIHKQIEAYEKEQKKLKWERRKKWHRMERIAIFVIVTSVGIFCVSMISEANRIRLGDKIRYLTGNEVIVRIGGDEQYSTVENDEEELLIYQDIKEEIGISVPRFSYKSDIKKNITYDISHENATAVIQYQYGDVFLDLNMVNKEKTETEGMAFHGKKIKDIDVMGGLITIPVQKVKDAQDIEPSLIAQWEYQDGYYQLSGKIKEKEFIEIVENIRF